MQAVANFVPIPRRRRVTESQIDSAEIVRQQQLQQQPPVQAPPAPPPSKRTVASMLGCVIEQVIGQSSHEQLQQDNVLLSSFTSTSEPPISVADYLFRLGSLIDNESTLVLAVYHIRTVLRVRPGFAITALNIHRLLLASLLCAVKVHEDKFYRNTQYAKVGGVLLQEINQLEFEFLSLVDFNLHVTGEEYEVFYKEMTNHELHAACKCAYGAALSTASPVSLGPARSKSQARLRPSNGAASPLQLFYSPSPSSPLSRASTPGGGGGGDSSSSLMSPYLAAHSPAMSSLSLGSSPIPLFPSTPTTPLPACSTNWTPADLLREPSRERIENSTSTSGSLPSSSSMPTLHEVAGETAESAEELRQLRQQQQQQTQQINQSVQQMQHAPPPAGAYYQQQPQQPQSTPQTPQQPAQFQPRRPVTAYSSGQRSQSFSGPSSSSSAFTPIEQAQLQHQIHQQQQLQQLQQFQQQQLQQSAPIQS